ncbi:cupin domain-containing protein [Candidatus Latescibacterota bacterium]
MVSKISFFCLLMVFALTAGSIAQTLDGSPYTPGKDANIDLYLCSWEDSEARITHGTLEERDILTRGNHLKPPAKGAVLEIVNHFSHATLPPNTSTEQTTLRGEQEVFYTLSGKGTIKTGSKTAELFSGIAVFMPTNLNFTITNTGDEPLTMYLINEPVPDGFKPVKNMVVKNENTTPLSGTTGHWCHIVKGIFNSSNGLAILGNVLTVQIDPMTIPHPHSHSGNFEEVWTQISGTSVAFIGKQIRWQPPGTGYMIPPDGNTPHSNINTSDEAVKLLYFMARQ